MTELEELAIKIAEETKLNPALALAVCKVESSWNPYAIRFELLFKKNYIDGKKVKIFGWQCSENTERIALATSWGLMQIMGATARGMGFDKVFLSELLVPETNLRLGCNLLSRLLEKWGKLDGAISAYNAGKPTVRNAVYVNKVKQEMKRYESLLAARD
jgi:soluble lytic murein transglycosylase-like protein